MRKTPTRAKTRSALFVGCMGLLIVAMKLVGPTWQRWVATMPPATAKGLGAAAVFVIFILIFFVGFFIFTRSEDA